MRGPRYNMCLLVLDPGLLLLVAVSAYTFCIREICSYLFWYAHRPQGRVLHAP